MAIFVITDAQRGWDCVCGIYEAGSEYDVKVYYAADCGIEEDECEQWFDDNLLFVHQDKIIKIN